MAISDPVVHHTGKNQDIHDVFKQLTEKIQPNISKFGPNTVSVTETALSAESVSAADRGVIDGAKSVLRSAIHDIVKDFGEKTFGKFANEGGLTLASENIGLSALMGTTPACKNVRRSVPKDIDSAAYWQPQRSEIHPLQGLTGESFKDQDLTNIMAANVTWNLFAARQSKFAEALFPLITIPPDQLGIMVDIRTIYRQPDYRRSINGEPTPLGRKSILAAAYDGTILSNDSLKIIPNWRETGDESDTTKFFIEKTKVQPYSVQRESSGPNRTVQTSWLKPGVAVDVLAIDQDAESFARSGSRDRTDILDPGVSLRKVLVEFTKGSDKVYIPFDLKFHPKNRFLPAQTANTKDMNIQFVDDGSFYIDAVSTVDANGNQQSVLDMFFPGSADKKNTIVVKLNMNGKLNVDTAIVNITNNGKAILDVIRDENNVAIRSGAYFTSISGLFDDAKIVGYELFCRRDNANRREQGMQFDTQHWKQFFSVPFLSPLAAKGPHGNEATNETVATAIEDLLRINATKMENDAVNKLFEFDEQLASSYRPVLDGNGDLPVIQPIGCHLVRTTRLRKILNVEDFVDSRSSSERMADIREGLLSQIELIAKQLYRDSRLKGAIAHYENSPEGKVTVIVATDQLTASYLYRDGEPLRPIGESFDLKVVDTIQENMIGKMFITFASNASERASGPNPLTFGMTLWSPEQVFSIKGYSVNNTIIDMWQIAPRYERFMNLPVLAHVDVVGLPELVSNKVALNMNDVTPPVTP